MISAIALVLAGIVVFVGPMGRRRRRLLHTVQEGIWVNRTSGEETAHAA